MPSQHLWFRALFLCLASLILISCGPVNRGLLLWSHDEPALPSGSLVNIFGESQLRGTYEIRYEDSGGNRQTAEIESWRLRFAQNATELNSLQEQYAPFAPWFGIAEIQALPVRESMSTSSASAIIYRLADREMVKILSQSESEIEVGGLQDYWFEILTEDGTRGYVFGHRLDRVNADGVSSEEKAGAIDEFLAGVIENVWYPEYFQQMIDNNIYDLNFFRDDYRFYHDAERFILVTPEHSLQFPYEELFRARYKEYLAIGSDLHILVYSDDRITLQYSVNDRAVSDNFIRLGDDINIREIIAGEQARRQGLIDSFLERGHRLRSSRHGNIILNANGRGSWQSYSPHNLDIFPEWFEGSFQLVFPLYLATSLQDKYDGALSLTQAGQSIRNSINFFYNYNSNGLRLEYIPSRNIAGNIVERQGRSPTIIFFNFSQ